MKPFFAINVPFGKEAFTPTSKKVHIMAQLTLREIIQLLDPHGHHTLPSYLFNMPIAGVGIDSREIREGELFFALRGNVHDGHNFLQEAAHKGAKAAVVAKDYEEAKPVDIPLIRVDNTLKALQQLARFHLTRSRGKIIAVTGSIGKTTTKDFISLLLASKYATSASLGNQNSQVGLMLSIINLVKGNEEFLVLEMGMTHHGNIERLIEIAPPEIAVVTTIALVHAENFNDLEDIARAKAEIFSHPQTRLGIINDDSPGKKVLLQKGNFPKKRYSSYQDSDADWQMQVLPDKLLVREEGACYELPKKNFGAPHVFTNCLAAVACARSCQMSWEEIAHAIPQLTLPKHRLQAVQKQHITFIDDSYNAAELSLKAALSYVKNLSCPGKKIAVIGQMAELGKFSAECHTRVGEHALDCVDHAVCYGAACGPFVEVWKKARKPIQWYANFNELVEYIQKIARPNDIVLLKGSRSNQLWRVLDYF